MRHTDTYWNSTIRIKRRKTRPRRPPTPRNVSSIGKRIKTSKTGGKWANLTKKKPSIKKLEKKLQKLLYPLIKKRDGNRCISCGRVISEKRDHQAGHYAKAELCNLIWRYAEKNINTQCGACNVWKRGNTLAYRRAMIQKYGEEYVEYLDAHYNEPLPLAFNPRSYLENLIYHYERCSALDRE